MADNIYEVLHGRSQYMAELSDKNGEFAKTAYKVIQGLYMVMVEKKVNPKSLKMDVNKRGNMLVIGIEAKPGSGASLEVFKKRNLIMAKMVSQIKDLNAFLYKIFYFCENYTVNRMYQTTDRSKIVLEGEEKDAGENAVI